MRNQEVSSSTTIKKSLKTTFISSAIGFSVIIFLTAIFAFLLTRSKLTDEKFYYLEFFIIAAGAILAGFLSAKKGRGKGIILGMLAGIPIMAASLLIPYIAFETVVTNRILITIPVILMFSVIGGIIGANKR